MSHSNKEIQLRKTCELYAYVLSALNKEVSDDILECASSYDYPVDCMKELAQTLTDLDSERLKALLEKPNSQEAFHLTNWWEMYQAYIPLENSSNDTW